MTRSSFIIMLALVGCSPRPTKLCKEIAGALHKETVHNCQAVGQDDGAHRASFVYGFVNGIVGLCDVSTFDTDANYRAWMTQYDTWKEARSANADRAYRSGMAGNWKAFNDYFSENAGIGKHEQYLQDYDAATRTVVICTDTPEMSKHDLAVFRWALEP
jgi:hypothetical protein